MRSSHTPRRLTLLALILVTPNLSGCATIGGTVLGALASKDQRSVFAYQLQDVPRGRRLYLTLRDGRTLRVWWIGMQTLDQAAYHAAWRRAASGDHLTRLPMPLDTVTWHSEPDADGRGAMLAFERDAIVVEPAAGGRRRVAFGQFDRLSWPGADGLSSLALHRLSEQGELPSPLRVHVEQPIEGRTSIMAPWRDTTIDVVDIRLVRMRSPGDSMRAGAAVGLLLDMTLVIGLMLGLASGGIRTF